MSYTHDFGAEGAGASGFRGREAGRSRTSAPCPVIASRPWPEIARGTTASALAIGGGFVLNGWTERRGRQISRLSITTRSLTWL